MMIISHSCDGMDDVLRTRFPYNSYFRLAFVFRKRQKIGKREIILTFFSYTWFVERFRWSFVMTIVLLMHFNDRHYTTFYLLHKILFLLSVVRGCVSFSSCCHWWKRIVNVRDFWLHSLYRLTWVCLFHDVLSVTGILLEKSQSHVYPTPSCCAITKDCFIGHRQTSNPSPGKTISINLASFNHISLFSPPSEGSFIYGPTNGRRCLDLPK